MFLAVLDEIGALDDHGLKAEFARIEAEERRLAARKAVVISMIERRSIPAGEGHRSTAGWVRAQVNCSSAEASAAVRAARLVHEHHVVGEAMHDGRIGLCHVAPLGRLRRNPRCGDTFGEVVDILVEHAATIHFDDYKLCVKRWELLNDPDGTSRDDQARHDNRTATVTTLDDGLFVHAAGANAAAIELVEIFDRFVEAEFLADWDAAVAEHGEVAATKASLRRTDAQRRFDALVAIFRAAASALIDAVSPLPIVNIVIDQATFEAHLAAAATGTPVERDPVEVLTSGRCETIDGKPVHPDDAIAAVLIGHVRRVVFDASGVVIDLGRRQRLFTGSARDAAVLQGRRCFHPGCQRPVHRCQIDHIQPWASGGSTSPANARVACAKHNRWLNLGYPVTRDRHGVWHIHQPAQSGTAAA